MKKILFGTAMLAVLALVGCKKEQSHLTLDGIAGVATVQGKVTYDMGTVDKGGVIVEKNVVAKEGATILLSVDYSDYGGTGTGKKQYTITTDAEGKYVFQVPVGVTPISAATVEVLPFNGSKGEMIDGQVVSIENALFDQVTYLNGKTKTVSLENQKVEVRDIEVSSTSTLDKTKISEKSFVVKGKVESQSETWNDKDKLSLGLKQTTAIVANRVVKITLSHTNSTDYPQTLSYTTQTNAEGIYSLSVKIFDAWEYEKVQVKVEVPAYYVAETADDDQKYKHLYYLSDATDVSKTQYLYGIFQKGETTAAAGALAKETGVNVSNILLVFKPDQQPVYGVNKNKKDDTTTYISYDIYSWSLDFID